MCHWAVQSELVILVLSVVVEFAKRSHVKLIGRLPVWARGGESGRSVGAPRAVSVSS